MLILVVSLRFPKRPAEGTNLLKNLLTNFAKKYFWGPKFLRGPNPDESAALRGIVPDMDNRVIGYLNS